MRPRSLTQLALVLCLGLCALGVCHASGQSESRLDDAKLLIQDKRFDDALLLLIKIERENPDIRDETRTLMEQIYAIRARGDLLIEQIIEALYTKNDVETALTLINELEAFDPTRTASIEKAKKSVVFVVNQNHLPDLMDAALELLVKKKYSEAITLYLEPLKYPEKTVGFDLHRKEFLEAGHGEIVEKDILNRVSELIGLSEAASSAEKDLADSVATAAVILKTKVIGEAEVKRFEEILSKVGKVTDVEASLRTLIEALGKTGTALSQQSADKRVDYYIQYIAQLCYGRKDKNEGIIRAIRSMWEGAAMEISADAQAGFTAAFDTARAFYDSGDSAASAAAFQDVPNRSIAFVAALALQGASFQQEQGWQFTLQDGQALKDLLGRAVDAQEKAAESRAYIALGSLKRDLAGLEPRNASIGDYRSLRLSLRTRIADGEALRQEWARRAQTYAKQAKLVASVANTQKSAEDMAGRFASYIADLQARDLEYAIRIADNDSSGFEPRLKSLITRRAKAEDLGNGTRDGQPMEGNPKYPSLALTELQSAARILQELQKDIDTYKNAWKAEVSYASGNDAIKQLIVESESIAVLVSKEIALIQEDDKKAREQHANAVEQSRLGIQYFDRAVALSKTDPEGADQLLTQSLDAYGKSLQYEEDDALRKRIGANGDIAKIQAQIAVALNARIITDVEALISAGIKLFINGDSINANQKFTQADQRWQEKHPGEAYSSVLTYYLELSRMASSVSGSREIPPTDPSYNVVSSYLNLANKNFLEAEKIIKSGKKSEAQKYLDNAKQNVDSVLSLFPDNRVARVLDLKLLKVTDEKNFPARLKTQMTGFIKDSQSPKLDDKRAAYLGLKNIQEFLPNDAALAKIIRALAQEIGIEQKTLDPAKVRESTQLTKQAQAIFDKKNQVTWQPAQELLDNALTLNPNNGDARNLYVTVLRMKSGIPPEPPDQKVFDAYVQAKDLFNKKLYNDAKIAVDKLNVNPTNAGYPPLKDLTQRINRILGI